MLGSAKKTVVLPYELKTTAIASKIHFLSNEIKIEAFPPQNNFFQESLKQGRKSTRRLTC